MSVTTNYGRLDSRISFKSDSSFAKYFEQEKGKNDLLTVNDFVYRLVGERLAQIKKQEEIEAEKRKISWNQISKIVDSNIISKDIKQMSEGEFDDFLEADFSRKSPHHD